MRNLLAFLPLALILTGPAIAVDLPTNALVEIVEGIDVQQTTAMNFGVLARSDGTVTVSAIDGSYTDASFIVYDATAISQGLFTVESIAGATLDLNCTPGVIPAGLSLLAFTVEWAESGVENPVPSTHVLTIRNEVMKLGASLTVISADMGAPLGAVELPYTVAVTFP
jgi:hypothetical protein